MIAEANIREFYAKYRKNLDIEQRVREALFHAKDQEDLVDQFRKRAGKMRRLYIENEALLNMYVRPFLSEESRCSDALAAAFLDEIRICEKGGYQDDLACVEVTHLLERHFRKNGDDASLIQALNLLGAFYNRLESWEAGKKSADYFKQIRTFGPRYTEFEDWETRSRILYSYYNYAAVLGNWRRVEDSVLLMALDEALAFYRDETVRSLDGERCDLDELVEELCHDVLGNRVCSMEKETADPAFLTRAGEVLNRLYEESLAQNPNPYEMKDEIFCNVLRCRYLSGELEKERYILEYKAYCDYVFAHDEMDRDGAFYDSRLFQVGLYHVSGLVMLLADRNLKLPDREALWESCSERFLSFIRSLPRTRNLSYVDGTIKDNLQELMPYLPEDAQDFQYVIEVTVARNPTALLHGMLVRQIVLRILETVLDQKPGLLTGVFGTASAVEVLRRRGEMESFAGDAAMIFDIGKLHIDDVIGKQTRRLTLREWEIIRSHPGAGYEIVKNAPWMKKYGDVILGHHKSYDGKFGYPAEFDNTVSPVRFFIDLIRLGDVMEAATDRLDRNYRVAKSFQEILTELEEGSGSSYNPDLVEMIVKDKGLRDDLEYLLETGRQRTLYELYQEYLKEDGGNRPETEDAAERPDETEGTDETDSLSLLNVLQETSQEHQSVLHSLERASAVILQVDLRRGSCRVVYRNPSAAPLFTEVKDGRYQEFTYSFLKSRMESGEWANFRLAGKLDGMAGLLTQNGGFYERECLLEEADGGRWVRLQFIQAQERGAVPELVTVAIQDIHESRMRSEKLKQALEDAYQSARKANEAKSIFLSSMSHDIRTPMNAIIGMTQIARMHLEDRERLKDCLDKIESSSGYLLGLINEVLDMSRLESGHMDLTEEPLNLAEALRSFVEVLRPNAEKKGQSLTLSFESVSSPHVLADRMRLQQIFVNLVSNAVKYTPEGGRIQVVMQEQPEKMAGYGFYQFQVRDNGIGMSEEFQKHLFEPFSREDNSMTGKEAGTGLGLCITRMAAGMMQGDITVDSVKGKGTVFTVLLQLKKDIRKTAPAERSEEKTTETASEMYDGKRVLLVEDNDLNREIAREILGSFSLEVEEAADGQQALERFRKVPDGWYDLIFMDIQMPVMNGYEAAKAIRALDRNDARQVPIVAMTANVFAEDVAAALSGGMNDHLGKPVVIDKLKEILARWLQTAGK
ncbi:ATP-binding protein [Lachnotalea sp. AF33-28]|uniref:ATP-binding protein n=1 Tax=Lachnotalea sp. AF33-28 TaxID=2292046 RepID=UPI000E510BB0|nr:ATP-binding protein [Lachnotalea sp. AF33-28]RHP32358.1 response regulator [Lachnotalea sp. AF33-28]